MLPQGELAQLLTGQETIRYMAVIELREGSVRGNHFHKIKREWIYMLSGQVRFTVQSEEGREEFDAQTGDLILIEPPVVHALSIRQTGKAIEYSPAPFDAGDIYRAKLV